MTIDDCLDAAPIVAVSHAGMIMWAIVFALVLAFEIWAGATGHQTLSQTVWKGPRWFRWLLGTGFIVLLVHLFL